MHGERCMVRGMVRGVWWEVQVRGAWWEVHGGRYGERCMVGGAWWEVYGGRCMVGGAG